MVLDKRNPSNSNTKISSLPERETATRQEYFAADGHLRTDLPQIEFENLDLADTDNLFVPCSSDLLFKAPDTKDELGDEAAPEKEL